MRKGRSAIDDHGLVPAFGLRDCEVRRAGTEKMIFSGGQWEVLPGCWVYLNAPLEFDCKTGECRWLMNLSPT